MMSNCREKWSMALVLLVCVLVLPSCAKATLSIMSALRIASATARPPNSRWRSARLSTTCSSVRMPLNMSSIVRRTSSVLVTSMVGSRSEISLF